MVTRASKKTRKAFRESLLEKLRDLSNGEQKLISNGTLRDTLGWDDVRYKRIKSQLLEENLLVIGRGFGGSVGLAVAPGAKALTLFISYSHADEKLKDELLKHLAPLKRLGLHGMIENLKRGT